MTIFEAHIKFNGLPCPYCGEKVVIEYDGKSLDKPFEGFVSGNKVKPCCLNFYEHLTDHLFMYREGRITEPELAMELNKYKY